MCVCQLVTLILASLGKDKTRVYVCMLVVARLERGSFRVLEGAGILSQRVGALCLAW